MVIAEITVQVGMSAFGLAALAFAMGSSPQLRRWAPVVGLVSQVFWFAFAWRTHRQGVDVRGLLVLCAAYTAVYLRGAVIQWSEYRALKGK